MMGSARQAADNYCRAVNEKSFELMHRLFSEDAVAINTMTTLTGSDEIVAFYRDVVFANDVSVEPIFVYDAGDTCVVELEGRMPSSPDVQRMVDIITVAADGRISRLAVYRR
jgi:ketosteroid isomerase-like protein